MTKPSIALADLLEKGADVDLLRQMIQHVAQRMMELDLEGICAAAYGELSRGNQSGRHASIMMAKVHAALGSCG